MKKDQVIARYNALVQELKEDPHNVVLSAGAALVMMGVRDEAEDLDADVLAPVFRWVSGSRTVLLEEGFAERIEYAEDIDLHILDEDTGIVCVDGVWIYSPQSMLTQKRYLATHPNRKEEKRVVDLAEVAVLEHILKQSRFTARIVA